MTTTFPIPEAPTNPTGPDPEDHAQPVQLETLFDTQPYKADKAAIKFAGNVGIDLTDDRYVDLFSKLTPGKDHKLTIEVRVTQFASKFTDDDGGYLDEVAGAKTVTVHTIYLPE